MAIKFSEIFGIKSQQEKNPQDLPAIEGMELSTASADLYKKRRDDVCFFYFKEGATFAGVYTKSSTKSHCIIWNKSITSKKIKALFVNTKNANTFTGDQGLNGLNEVAKKLTDTRYAS